MIDKTGWTLEEISELTFNQLESLINVWTGKKETKGKKASKKEVSDFVKKLRSIR